MHLPPDVLYWFVWGWGVGATVVVGVLADRLIQAGLERPQRDANGRFTRRAG